MDSRGRGAPGDERLYDGLRTLGVARVLRRRRDGIMDHDLNAQRTVGSGNASEVA